jgi:serine/threonine-protein kinase OSR1/STK39
VEDHPHYPCSADDYDICQEIGIGAFATVFRGVVRETGEEVAIKVIDLDQFNTNWEEIRREILVMSLLHHPNVVPIKCSFVDGQDLWIVMPLLEAGSCAAIMKQIAPNGFRDEALIATILKETLQGLQYFHKDGRIHRDLKAGNILIGWNGSVELGDFGVAGTLMENGDRKRNVQTFTGSLCWMAPEVMEHSAGYDEKADIWSRKSISQYSIQSLSALLSALLLTSFPFFSYFLFTLVSLFPFQLV